MGNLDQGESIEGRIEAALYGSDEGESIQTEPVEVNASDAEAVEVEAAEPEEVLADTPDDDEGEAEVSYQTLEDLAEALDMTPEDFLAKTMAKTKVFDKETEVTLADLQAGYQKGVAFDEKKAELAKAKAAFTQEQLNHVNQMQQEAQTMQQMGSMYEQALMSEFNSIDWENLRQNDPIEYANLRPAYEQKMAQIQGVRQQAAQLSEMSWMQRQPYANAELLNAIPEWTDPEVAQEGKQEIIQLLSEAGADQQLFAGVQRSPTAITLLHELATLRKAVKQPPEAKTQKKVEVKRSTILKSGPRKSQSEKQRSKADQLKARLKKSGSKTDLQAVLLERM